MMLIPDLLNFLFDQSDCLTLITLSLLNKRQTVYANKYSLLQNQVDDTVKEGFNSYALSRLCAIHGNLKIIKRLVNKGNAYGAIMTYIAKNGYLEIMKYLVGAGYDIHIDNDGPVRAGASNGNINMVKYLISIGARINRSIHASAVSLSASNGHLETVKYLVKVGAIVDRHHCDEGLLNSVDKGYFEVVKYLCHCHAQFAKVALRRCVSNGYLDMVKYFVEIGTDIHGVDLLNICAEYGQLEIIKYLVSIDANWDYDKALILSASNGNLEVVEYLVSIGANAKLKGALFGSAKNGHLKTVKYLISVGACISCVEYAVLVGNSMNIHDDIAHCLMACCLGSAGYYVSKNDV